MKKVQTVLLALGVTMMTTNALSQDNAVVTVDAGKPGSHVSPNLHGIFFEEISHAGEGGLYAELIQNRGFEESRLPQGTTLENGFIVPPRTPHFSIPGNKASDWKMEWPIKSQWPAWSAVTTGRSEMNISLTDEHPLNNATPHSLQVEIRKADPGGSASLVNDGFWGINTVAGQQYRCSFYLRTEDSYKGAFKASLQSADGTSLADFSFKTTSGSGWKKYSCLLTAAKSDPSAKFLLSFGKTGKLWVDFVSLFPVHTFMNRPNGLRNDLATYIADLKPAFIRWPGGCFVEGIDIQSAPDWKRTIGPVEQRPGTYSPWGYWTSDGFGYHEYLQFCEDIGAAALYVFNAGVSCDFRSGTFVTDDSLQPYIQSALDAIEYAVGPDTGKWGKVRAASGHPKPFPLKYVEVGNEQSGPRYAKRFNRFYDAIKEKYPDLIIIGAMGIGDVNKYTLDSMHRVDMADEHAYKAAYWAMDHYDHFDRHQRSNWDMYVGEYATNNGVGNGNMEAALSDAVYIMSMEKNGDLVKMSSYAPLLVNVNDVDWPVNLINFNASASFARISYYAIKMMSDHRADLNLDTKTQLFRQKDTTALFAGGIGLGTWDTQTAYKDIEVVQDGKLVYHSDMINRPEEWNKIRGSWQTKDSALVQTAEGPQLFATLKDKNFGKYTLTLKAKKLGGYNAFIIPFAVKDTNTYLRAHIGSWVNSHSVIERVTNGYDVVGFGEARKLNKPIEQDRWYTIKLEVGADTVKCWLDDELLLTYHEPDKFFALAGKNEKTGDLILKVVNAYDKPYKTTIDLKGMTTVGATGELTTLSSGSAGAENSFLFPKKYHPVTTALKDLTPSFETTFPPFSISILNIRSK